MIHKGRVNLGSQLFHLQYASDSPLHWILLNGFLKQLYMELNGTPD
jgi:hypothetical protein